MGQGKRVEVSAARRAEIWRRWNLQHTEKEITIFAKTKNQSGRTPTESATILDPTSGYHHHEHLQRHSDSFRTRRASPARHRNGGGGMVT
jgi:hypothetical protein